MTKAEDSKQYDLEAGLLVFEFRYCLGFSTSDLGLNPCWTMRHYLRRYYHRSGIIF